MTAETETRPFGVQPERCEWYYGLDDFVMCGVHLWDGTRDERTCYAKRLICPVARARWLAAPESDRRMTE